MSLGTFSRRRLLLACRCPGQYLPSRSACSLYASFRSRAIVIEAQLSHRATASRHFYRHARLLAPPWATTRAYARLHFHACSTLIYSPHIHSKRPPADFRRRRSRCVLHAKDNYMPVMSLTPPARRRHMQRVARDVAARDFAIDGRHDAADSRATPDATHSLMPPFRRSSHFRRCAPHSIFAADFAALFDILGFFAFAHMPRASPAELAQEAKPGGRLPPFLADYSRR